MRPLHKSSKIRRFAVTSLVTLGLVAGGMVFEEEVPSFRGKQSVIALTQLVDALAATNAHLTEGKPFKRSQIRLTPFDFIPYIKFWHPQARASLILRNVEQLSAVHFFSANARAPPFPS